MKVPQMKRTLEGGRTAYYGAHEDQASQHNHDNHSSPEPVIGRRWFWRWLCFAVELHAHACARHGRVLASCTLTGFERRRVSFQLGELFDAVPAGRDRPAFVPTEISVLQQHTRTFWF